MLNNHHKHEQDVIQEFCRLLEMHDIVAAKKLITKDNVNYRDACGNGIAVFLCDFGPDDAELLHHFVNVGAQIEHSEEGWWSPLHRVAYQDKHNLARELINLGIPVDGFNSQPSTPLRLACQRFCKKTAMVLLDAGAKLSLVKDCSESITWAHKFVTFREKVRQSCIVVLGLLKCKSRVLNAKESGSESGSESSRNLNVNGMDVLRIISRCTWGLRGVDFEAEVK